MPFEQETSRVLPYPMNEVFSAALESIQYMGGKTVKKNAERWKLTAQMDKKLFGEYLGDRSQLEIQFMLKRDVHTKVYIYAYPLNAIGQKLMFGARKGVVDTILKVFFEELEKRLKAASSS